jgi:hypothetical protein
MLWRYLGCDTHTLMPGVEYINSVTLGWTKPSESNTSPHRPGSEEEVGNDNCGRVSAEDSSRCTSHPRIHWKQYSAYSYIYSLRLVVVCARNQRKKYQDAWRDMQLHIRYNIFNGLAIQLSEVCFGSSRATVNHSQLRQICIRDLMNIQYLIPAGIINKISNRGYGCAGEAGEPGAEEE